MVVYRHVWSSMIRYGHILYLCKVINGNAWLYRVMYGHIWSCVVMFGLAWSCVVKFIYILSCMVMVMYCLTQLMHDSCLLDVIASQEIPRLLTHSINHRVLASLLCPSDESK